MTKRSSDNQLPGCLAGDDGVVTPTPIHSLLKSFHSYPAKKVAILHLWNFETTSTNLLVPTFVSLKNWQTKKNVQISHNKDLRVWILTSHWGINLLDYGWQVELAPPLSLQVPRCWIEEKQDEELVVVETNLQQRHHQKTPVSWHEPLVILLGW